MRPTGLVLALVLCWCGLEAQQQPRVTAIRAGVLIDGTGAAPVRNAIIVVQGDRITAVGPGVAIPKGATVVDLSGETVLPGFIDAHVHLIGRLIGDGDWQHSGITELPSAMVLLGAAHAQQTLEAGSPRSGSSGRRDSPISGSATRSRPAGCRVRGSWAPGSRSAHVAGIATRPPASIRERSGTRPGTRRVWRTGWIRRGAAYAT
jgi:hypothetical protein